MTTTQTPLPSTSTPNSRLGRGLDALISAPASNPSRSQQARLTVGAIQKNPFQPRKEFDGDELKSLCESIKTHGVLQPLVVRKVGNDFQLIAGERRLRAAQVAGMQDVPVHIVEFNDQQVFEAALVENIQRSDLNAIEKAQGFKDYLDRFKMTQDQLGAKLGMDRTTISNLIGLLNLPAAVQDAVRLGQISLGHAKIIKGVADAPRQIELCKETILKNYSVHALEAVVKEQRQREAEAAAAALRAADEEEAKSTAINPNKTAHVASLENDLRHRLALRVEIKVKGKDKGQIVLGFENNADFERIVAMLQK
ncbi:MAG: ParB/RepB/Spo0J family partition protein [Gemmataceae bacterium]